MTDLAFAVNGVDFSALVHKNGYATDLEPVYAGQYTDLNQVDHYILKRYRGIFCPTLNDLEAQQSLELCDELLKPQLNVTYFSFQRGRVVTEAMRLTSIPREQLMRTRSRRWLAGVTLRFEQL